MSGGGNNGEGNAPSDLGDKNFLAQKRLIQGRMETREELKSVQKKIVKTSRRFDFAKKKGGGGKRNADWASTDLPKRYAARGTKSKRDSKLVTQNTAKTIPYITPHDAENGRQLLGNRREVTSKKERNRSPKKRSIAADKRRRGGH